MEAEILENEVAGPLVVVDDVLSLAPEKLYHPLVIDALIEWLDKETKGFDADPATVKGRAAIGSFARKIGSTKTGLDNHRKATVDGWTRATKEVNQEAKRFKDFCDETRDAVLAPRDAWEESERLRLEAEETAREIDKAHEEANGMEALLAREREIARKEAVKEEQARVEAQAQDDQLNRSRVFGEIKGALSKIVTETQAGSIVDLIEAGKIPNVKIVW